MNKLALCLPGGGACGRWQAGVMQYLCDINVLQSVDIVCGTSVGGLNGLLFAKDPLHFSENVKLWEKIKSNKDVYLGMLQFNNFFDILGMVGQLFKTNKGKSLLDPAPLYRLIDKTFGDMQIKDLKLPVRITATNLNVGERIVIDSETCSDYKVSEVAKATSAIPIVFPAVDYWREGEKELCVDGGLGRNNPVEIGIESGATHIILIGTSPDIYPPKKVKNNVLDIAVRTQDIIMRTFEEEAWEEKEYREKLHMIAPEKFPEIKILDIYPETSTGSALDFCNVASFYAGYKFAAENFPQEIFDAFQND